ncbi:hypothetical protein Goklo_027778 [Gossypium klotzschianum]|uniref:Uncharacterized protein n=1 Tax=Gossypium klotzschianum TaxID=34286 RepID=A0A7J8TZ20_9ROSI|nr:hypothetical protein [Gossypium klotzschianum]
MEGEERKKKKEKALEWKKKAEEAVEVGGLSYIDFDRFVKEALKHDGLVRLGEGFVAAGGYICDHNGGWIIGFCRYLGNCTVTEAKLFEDLGCVKPSSGKTIR